MAFSPLPLITLARGGAALSLEGLATRFSVEGKRSPVKPGLAAPAPEGRFAAVERGEAPALGGRRGADGQETSRRETVLFDLMVRRSVVFTDGGCHISIEGRAKRWNAWTDSPPE
jgi:hypothetical protein